MSPSRTRESFWVDGLYLDEHGFYGFDGKMDSETFSTAGDHVGRNNMPALLFDLVQRGVLGIEQHPVVVVEAWMMAEFPASNVHPEFWVDWFETAGYTHNGHPSPRPKAPVTQYRGCAPERRFGMSWTTGSHCEAARLFGAADAMRQRMGEVRFKIYDAVHETLVAALRDAMGEKDFESAWAEGAGLSTDEAIAYAQRRRGERKRPTSGWASLTPTERDVVRLVSEGLANNDIATRLFVSPRTVQTHLTHVYTKLALSSRVQLAQEAARHG